MLVNYFIIISIMLNIPTNYIFPFASFTRILNHPVYGCSLKEAPCAHPVWLCSLAVGLFGVVLNSAAGPPALPGVGGMGAALSIKCGAHSVKKLVDLAAPVPRKRG